MKFTIGNPILSFLGTNSLEMYLVQGLFIRGLRSSIVYIENDALWALITIVGSVVLGFVLHYFSKLLLNYKK